MEPCWGAKWLLFHLPGSGAKCEDTSKRRLQGSAPVTAPQAPEKNFWAGHDPGNSTQPLCSPKKISVLVLGRAQKQARVLFTEQRR